MAILIMHAVLEMCLTIINHFPLFTLLLNVKDPDRLAGGLDFTLIRSSPNAKGTYILLRNKRTSLGQIFKRYFTIWSRFSDHYLTFQFLVKLAVGVQVEPIERKWVLPDDTIQKKRPTIEEFWTFVK